MIRLLRRLLVKIAGPPVCRSCAKWGFTCIRRCGMTAAERRQLFVDTGALPR